MGKYIMPLCGGVSLHRRKGLIHRFQGMVDDHGLDRFTTPHGASFSLSRLINSRADLFSKFRLLDFSHCVARKIFSEDNGFRGFIGRELFSTKTDQLFAGHCFIFIEHHHRCDLLSPLRVWTADHRAGTDCGMFDEDALHFGRVDVEVHR